VCLLGAAPEPPPEFQAEPLIIAREPVLFAGDSGSMKTTCAVHLGAATAIGAAIFGRFPAQAGAVLFVSGEDPLGVIQNRVEAMIRGHGWPREKVLANLHVLALAGTDLAAGHWRAHLLALVQRLGVKLVILDPLADLATGDENDNSARREVVATWRAPGRGWGHGGARAPPRQAGGGPFAERPHPGRDGHPERVALHADLRGDRRLASWCTTRSSPAAPRSRRSWWRMTS
jgi:hypothetical protein